MRILAAGRRLVAVAVGAALVAVVPVADVVTLAPAAAQTPTSPMVTVYGAAGSFRGLIGPTASATGHLVAPASTLGWKPAPGASSLFGALTPGGRVVMGTVPQTDNQIASTGTTTSLQVFDPTSPLGPTFTSVVVPTSTGATTVANAAGVGGADISDVCVVDTPWGSRVAGVTAVPWRAAWPAAAGHFPSLTLFAEMPGVQSATGVVLDVAHSRDAASLAASDPVLGPLAFPTTPVDEGEGTYERNQGTGSCARLPGTGHLAVGNYYSTAGRTSGSVVVLAPDGSVAGFHQVADEVLGAPLAVARGDGSTVTFPAGTPVILAPRELRADPHTTAVDDQRFVVVYDAFVEDPAPLDPRRTSLQVPFPVQELRFDASTGALTPTSPLLVTDADGSLATDDALHRATTTVYAPDGTLFVARAPGTGPASLQASAMAVFRPGALASAATGAAALGARVAPDALVAAAGSAAPWGNVSVTRAIAFDAATGSVLTASLDAQLRSFRWAGWGPSGAAPVAVACPVDLGRDLLAPPLPGYALNIRNGPLDGDARRWYLPYQALQPRLAAQVEEVLDSYLLAVDVDQVAASTYGACPVAAAPAAMAGALVPGQTPAASSASVVGAGGAFPDRPRGVASGPYGSTFVTGTYFGSATFGTGPKKVTLGGGGQQGFLARYDAAGTLVWAVRLTTAGGAVDPSAGVAVDAAGNAYVAGRFEYTATFGSGAAAQPRTARGADDGFVARFSPSGALAWVRTFGGESSGDEAQAVAVAPDGDVVIGTTWWGTATFEAWAGTRTGTNDVAVVRYGPDGSVRWVTGMVAPHVESAEGIAVDGDGRTIVTGAFQRTATFDGGTTLAGAGSAITGYVATLDPAGAVVWARAFGGATTDDQARGLDVAVLGDGSLAVAGAVRGTAAFGPGGPTLTSQAGFDGLVARYDAAGTPLHVTALRGSADEVAWGVAPLPSGQVAVVGHLRRAVTPTAAPSPTLWGRSSAVVAVVGPSGELAWSALQTPVGAGSVVAVDVAAGACGALKVLSRATGRASITAARAAPTFGSSDVVLAIYGRPAHPSFATPGC